MAGVHNTCPETDAGYQTAWQIPDPAQYRQARALGAAQAFPELRDIARELTHITQSRVMASVVYILQRLRPTGSCHSIFCKAQQRLGLDITVCEMFKHVDTLDNFAEGSNVQPRCQAATSALWLMNRIAQRTVPSGHRLSQVARNRWGATTGTVSGRQPRDIRIKGKRVVVQEGRCWPRRRV